MPKYFNCCFPQDHDRNFIILELQIPQVDESGQNKIRRAPYSEALKLFKTRSGHVCTCKRCQTEHFITLETSNFMLFGHVYRRIFETLRL